MPVTLSRAPRRGYAQAEIIENVAEVVHMGKTWADTGRLDNGPRAIGVTTLSEGLQGANYGVTPEFTEVFPTRLSWTYAA